MYLLAKKHNGKGEEKEGNFICLCTLVLKYLYSEFDSSYFFGFVCVSYKILSIIEGMKLDKSWVYHVYMKNIVWNEWIPMS